MRWGQRSAKLPLQCVVNREKMMRSDGSISVCYCPSESFLRFAVGAIQTRMSVKGAERENIKSALTNLIVFFTVHA